MAELILKIGGQQFSGWQNVRVRRSIEQLAATFELKLTERWATAGEGSQPWEIRHGDACTLSLDNNLVITGYVDDTLPQFDADNHSIDVVGRGRSGDLIDCSAIHKSGEWKNRNMLQIATDLVAPFGIKVSAATDIGVPFKKFSIQEGETCFEAIERMARMRGVLVVEDPAGNLLIIRTDSDRIVTALVQGQNILTGSAAFSLRDRYSKVTVKGADIGSDWSTPEQNAQPAAEAIDKAVGRYRPLIIIAEEPANNSRLRTRALWEVAVRMGRSARPIIGVQGWQHADGLWLPNRLVSIQSPYLQLDREMLISAVTYVKDENGTRSELELVRPEAFELLAQPESQEVDPWS